MEGTGRNSHWRRFTLVSVGVQGSYLFVAALAGIGVVAVALFGTETKGRTQSPVLTGEFPDLGRTRRMKLSAIHGWLIPDPVRREWHW